MKIPWNILRTIVTAPEVIHWIKKYEAVKKENKELREEMAILKGKNGLRD